MSVFSLCLLILTLLMPVCSVCRGHLGSVGNSHAAIDAGPLDPSSLPLLGRLQLRAELRAGGAGAGEGGADYGGAGHVGVGQARAPQGFADLLEMEVLRGRGGGQTAG